MVGQEILHATPRTVTESDATLYLALTGSRFAVHCSATLARMAGLPRPPLEDLLTFHLAFGRSVPDVSLQRDRQSRLCRWPLRRAALSGRHPDRQLQGDRPQGELERQERHGLRAHARDQGRRPRDPRVRALGAWSPSAIRRARRRRRCVPELPDHVAAERLTVPPGLRPRHFDRVLSGSMYRYDSYEIGERIDHVDGMTIDEAEHRLATRLYQNPARVHFNAHAARAGRFGRCLGVRRPRAQHRPGAVLQRPRQRPAHRRDQRRHPRQPGVRGRHDLRLVGGPGQSRARRPSRSRRAAPAPGRDQGPAVRAISRTGTPRASTCPRSCSTSTTGASCCAEPRHRHRSR